MRPTPSESRKVQMRTGVLGDWCFSCIMLYGEYFLMQDVFFQHYII